MHVGFLQTSFADRAFGGGEVHTEHLSRALERLGHQVTIFTDEPIARRKGLEDLDVRLYRTPMKKNPVNEIALAERAWDDVHECDVVTLTDDSAWRGVDVARPTVMVFHFVWHGWVARNRLLTGVLRRKPQALLYRRMEHKIARKADAIVSISPNVRRDIDLIGDFGDKIHPIPNGVDIDRFEPVNDKYDRFTVYFQGRLVGMKNPDLLVEAANQSAEDWRLVIGGDGPLRAELEALVREYGLGDRVKFLGFVPDDELPARYARSHVYALPSSYEGMPLTILEACASGTACVVSPRASTDLVDEDIGRVVDPSPDMLARLLDNLARNEEEAIRLGSNARRRSKRYAWSEIAEQYEHLYRSVTHTG